MMQAPRDLPVDVAAVMAAVRLTLTPQDPQALSDLKDRAARMGAEPGESERRRAFRVAAQGFVVEPSPERMQALATAMADYNRHELLPLARPAEDPRPGRGRQLRPGINGVAKGLPTDPDDINTDL